MFIQQTPATKNQTVVLNIPSKTNTPENDSLRSILEAQSSGNFYRLSRTEVIIPKQSDITSPLSYTFDQLDKLYDLEENWNGYEVASPNPDAIEHARSWIGKLYLETQEKKLRWIKPHVTANEEGNAVFEWAKNKRRIVIYVSPKNVDFLKIWGPNILDEMIDGEAMNGISRSSIWEWLLEL